MPPHMRRAMRSTMSKCPCLLGADWCLQSYDMTDLRLQALKSAIVMNRKGIEISITKGKREARVAPPETKTAEKATAVRQLNRHYYSRRGEGDWGGAIISCMSSPPWAHR